MFDIELKNGKRKRKSPGLQQPLPVPIASLTGIKANDAIWRFYHGKWNQELNMVVIENPQEIEFVKNMGSFGTIFRHWRAKRTKKGRIFRQKNVITDFLWGCSLIKLVIKITLVDKTHTNLRMKYFILASTKANL